jgi:hypothetical protein
MKLFIPSCGDRIVLSSAWTFDLYFNESRNRNFSKENGVLITFSDVWTPDWQRKLKESTKFTLKENTVLECDRVYIRTSAKISMSKDENYDSITWRVIGSKTKQRFWAKLSDCNNIEYHTDRVVPFENRKIEKKSKVLTAEIIREKIHNSMFSSNFDDEEQLEFRTLISDAQDEVSKYFETFHKRYAFAFERNLKYDACFNTKHPNAVDETYFFQLLRSYISDASCSFSKTKERKCKRVFHYGKYIAECIYFLPTIEYALKDIRIIVFSDENDQKITSVKIECPKEET